MSKKKFRYYEDEAETDWDDDYRLEDIFYKKKKKVKRGRPDEEWDDDKYF